MSWKRHNNNALGSTLRKSAPDFVPAHLSPPNTSGSQESSNRVVVVEIRKTIKSQLENAVLETYTSIASITESIRQIPTNLEQQLSKHEQEDAPIVCNKIHINLLPQNQASHTSLPDSYHSEIKRNHSQSQNFHQSYRQQKDFGPKRHENNFRFDHRPHFLRHDQSKLPGFVQKHRNNNNNNNYYYNRNQKCHDPEMEANRNEESQNHSKVDQECTAHPIKDINNNFNSSEADETKDLKDLSMMDLNNNEENFKDMNNNEIKTGDTNLTGEESQIDSTTENSLSSLNTSLRYSQEKLTELKKSPLVLTRPPTVKTGLLDSKLDGKVWNILFGKSFHENSR
jgi:hypothetical protein